MKFHYWNCLPSKNKYIKYFIQHEFGCLFEKVKNNPENLGNYFQDFPYISHYQIGNLVSYLLGYQKQYEYFNTKEDYYVCGADISGFDGILKISFDKENNLSKDFNFIK